MPGVANFAPEAAVRVPRQKNERPCSFFKRRRLAAYPPAVGGRSRPKPRSGGAARASLEGLPTVRQTERKAPWMEGGISGFWRSDGGES
jgi:hypothetical protein